MGSKGRKPRKPKHSQHLPKVGTATDNERLLHAEREAVFGQMGVHGASTGVKIVVIALIVVLFAGAILGLVILW